MLMSSKMSIAVLVIITLIATNSLSEAAAADNVNLPDLLGTFSNKDMDCATTYVTSCYAESPELRCCQLIDSILSTDMACLCSLYENSHLTNGEGVSVLTLCQVSSDSLLRCNVGGNVTDSPSASSQTNETAHYDQGYASKNSLIGMLGILINIIIFY